MQKKNSWNKLGWRVFWFFAILVLSYGLWWGIESFRYPPIEALQTVPDGQGIVVFTGFNLTDDVSEYQIYIYEVENDRLSHLNISQTVEGGIRPRLSWSPVQERFLVKAIINEDLSGYFLDLAGQLTPYHFWRAENPLGFDLSQDGKYLAFFAGGDLQIQNTITDDSITILEPLYVRDPEWHPNNNSQLLASIAEDDAYHSSIFQVDFQVNEDGADLTQITEPSSGHNIRAKWSPDGRKVAYLNYVRTDKPNYYSTTPMTLWITNLDDLSSHQLFEIDGEQAGAGITSFDWSPDGQKFFFASGMENDCYLPFMSEWTICPQFIYTINVDGTDLKRLSNYKFARGVDIEWIR